MSKNRWGLNSEIKNTNRYVFVNSYVTAGLTLMIFLPSIVKKYYLLAKIVSLAFSLIEIIYDMFLEYKEKHSVDWHSILLAFLLAFLIVFIIFNAWKQI
jgi:hypothetical protein